MNLITQFLNKKETKEFFLTLGIEEHHIRAAISQVTENEITLIGSGEKEVDDFKEITEAADLAVTEAEKGLPPGQLIQKVIFTLPISYISEDKIKTPQLTFLKKLSEDLDLKPYGFIEYPSAISYLYEKEEGSPPTMLLLSIGKKLLDITFVRVGKVNQNITLERTDNIINDFEKGIKEIKSDILPSRIILYDESENLDSIKEEFLKLPWHKQSSFLHTPKIEILPSNKIIEAIVESTGSSLIKNIQIEHKVFIEHPIDKNTIDSTFKENRIEPDIPTLISHPRDNLDINLEKETFGFVQENTQPLSGIKNQSAMTNAHSFITIPPKPEKSEKDDILTGTGKKENKLLPGIKIPRITGFKLPLPTFSYGIILIVIMVMVLTVELIFSYINYPKASVSLIIYPISISKTIDATFLTESKNANTDKKNFIKLTPVTVEVDGEKTVQATGKIKVGEKAKGEVIIYNKTNNSKSFPKGAILSTKGISFSLSSEVKVASASDTGEGLIFGKITAPVTANNIGNDGNLPTDNVFIFKDFPDTSYTAKNQKPFTGGSSREVPSISKEDRDKLENSLTNELINKAKGDIYQKLNSRDAFLNTGFQTETISKKFSADAGTEGNEVNLKLTIKITGYSYSREDIKNLADNTDILSPSGYLNDESRSNYIIDNTKQDKNGTVTAKVNITKYFLPQIDTGNIVSQITGKNYNQAKDIVKTTANIAGIKIINEQNLPFYKDKLPLMKKNISLNIVSY